MGIRWSITTAVFIIKYLRSLGFDVNNTTFEKNSWYFRNALVRANYQNLQKGIYKEIIHLERLFSNLLMGEENVLMHRHLHIKAKELLDGTTPTSVFPESENIKRLNSAIAEKFEIIYYSNSLTLNCLYNMLHYDSRKPSYVEHIVLVNVLF